MSIARQYGLIGEPKVVAGAGQSLLKAAEKALVKASTPEPAKPAKLAKARKALAGTENRGTEIRAGTENKRKRGRPAKAAKDKPWEKAGMSRSAFYRQQKTETKG